MSVELGVFLGRVMHGQSSQDLVKKASVVDTLVQEDSEGDFYKEAAVLIRSMYEQTGRQNSFGYCLYNTLCKEASWCPQKSELVVPALSAIGRKSRMFKQANVLMSGLDAIGKTTGNVAKAFPKALAVAALLGGGAGLAAYHLGEDRLDDDDDVVRNKAQIRYLNEVVDEIDDELYRRQLGFK